MTSKEFYDKCERMYARVKAEFKEHRGQMGRAATVCGLGLSGYCLWIGRLNGVLIAGLLLVLMGMLMKNFE